MLILIGLPFRGPLVNAVEDRPKQEGLWGTYGDKDKPSGIMTLVTDLEKMRPLLWLAFNPAPKSREKVRSFVQGADSIDRVPETGYE